MMKNLKSIVLMTLLLAMLTVPALAEGAEPFSESEFSIEELPAFGEEDVIFFPSEATAEPETTAEPTKAQEPIEELDPQTENSEESMSQEEPAEANSPTEGEGDMVAPSPAPEAETVPSEHNNYPVILIAAVLALGAIALIIAKKHMPTADHDE